MAVDTSRQTPSPINTQLSDSPPLSATGSPSTLSNKRSRSPLSLDLASLPALTSPSPPSNTLLITRLTDPKIFHPASLATIRQHLNSISPLNSFSPLKSMQRIIVSFHTDDAAIAARQAIDGTAFSTTSIAKCYFGEPTPIGDGEKKYLDRPDAGRLFFISPPPSPPVGWEMRSEDPPNKQVHAEDLASKLQSLTGRMADSADYPSPTEDSNQQQNLPTYTTSELSSLKTIIPNHRTALSEDMGTPRTPTAGDSPKKMRSRSSTLIYDPKAHGDSPALPAVMLETEDDSDVELDAGEKRIPTHTARPPVELMEH
jgi:hypothetical protein